MANGKNYKRIDGLMAYLRESGININGSKEKRQLLNYGYYHGYKGYRFFKNPANKIPFTEFSDIATIIDYDNQLKSLFYPHLMFIETALKNVSLDFILKEAKTNEIDLIFSKILPGKKAAPVGANAETKKKYEIKKLKIQHNIRNTLLSAYSRNNKIISNFYDKPHHFDVPIWAVFEIINLGDFGSFISCLETSIRRDISRFLDLDLSGDTNMTLISDLIFVIKDLRNSVAHNDIIFDTRFRKSDIRRPLQTCMTHDMRLPYANFKEIIDYVALVVYLLIKFKLPKRQINMFVNAYEKEVQKLGTSLPNNIYNMLIHADTQRKIGIIKQFIKLN